MNLAPINDQGRGTQDVRQERVPHRPSFAKGREDGLRVREREAANEEWSNEGGSHEKEP